MYIAGTSDFNDALTDTLIPLHLLKQSKRYKAAEQKLKLYPEVKNIVGHSLGGAVGTELVADNKQLHGRMYGSPNVLPHERTSYYRHYGDPVSMLNVGPNVVRNFRFPNFHSYRGFNT